MVKLLKAQPGCASWCCVDLVPAFPFGDSFKAALRLVSKMFGWIHSLHHTIYLITEAIALKQEGEGGRLCPTGGPRELESGQHEQDLQGRCSFSEREKRHEFCSDRQAEEQ